MAVTYQESVEKLLSGDDLSWDKHSGHAAGQIALVTPGARRLFDYLIGQKQDAVSKGEEAIFPGLIAAWDDEERDPKDALVAVGAIAGASGFRLAAIETEGFGGLNLYDGPLFSLDVDRQSWCLEGQNGSGKTSLASAIIWGMTGRRIREHLGPVVDTGAREPVLDGAGNKIGTWPPLASYPARVADLVQDARVRVKLTFKDAAGDEALVERSIVSKVGVPPVTEKKAVDPRLLSVPQFVESGILMPSRMAHINFGDKSQSLYDAVKALTGLDQIGAIGEPSGSCGGGGITMRRWMKFKNRRKQPINSPR